MSKTHAIARNLAAAFLDGAWSLEALARRGAQACGHSGRWMRPLVRRVVTAFDGDPASRTVDSITALLFHNEAFRKICAPL